MKKSVIMALAAIAMFTSCMKVKQVGKVNMISNRNVESKLSYEPLRTYMGGSKKELKKLKAETIEQAVDNVVKNTPGGEYLMNVKIYLVNTKYFAVEGDVWGLSTEQNFKGFKVGDSVQWKDATRTFKGTVVDLKDAELAIIKDDVGKLRKVKYSEMLKSK